MCSLIQALKNYFAVILCSPIFYSFWLSLKFIHSKFGLLQVIVGILVAPITIIISPIYLGLFEGKWTAALLLCLGLALITTYVIKKCQFKSL